jgi:uncharacterized protein YndB with AHSA1/START domain
MTSATESEHDAPGDIVVTRVFDAPRELVFEVWTVAEHLARWFGPRAAETVSCTIDPRPGGVIQFCHQSADGMRLWAKGAFQEVIAPERLVFTLAIVDAEGRPTKHPMVPDWPEYAVIETRVSLEVVGHGTRVTVHSRVTPPEAASLDSVAFERRLARQGWAEVFDKLAEHLVVAARGTRSSK